MPLRIKTKKTSHILAFSITIGVLFVSSVVLSPLSPASADISLLKKSIIAYNTERLKKSLTDGTYRGEEGILTLNPEVGRSLGLKVLIDQDYLDSMQLFKEADSFLEKAVKALTAEENKRFPEKQLQDIAESALFYQRSMQSARERLIAYRSKLIPGIDERLDYRISSSLLERLLKESLARASCNLRDALGYFYNRCQGLSEEDSPLNSENVLFVNHVFSEFIGKAPETSMKRFDLDRDDTVNSEVNLSSGWKHALGRGAARYIGLLEPLLGEHKKARYRVDILLFLSLIKQESNFNPRNVSHVGAAGLTQIMPNTASKLGMENIFIPPYFNEARSLVERERVLKRKAMAIITRITEENKLELAGRARKLMQQSLDCERKRTKLYALYKRELLKKGTDARLDPRKAIEYGLKYFAQMMKIQKGDISLALASYNAGPHRVKQYRGIPPYPETISFRNRILAYYRDYLRRLNRPPRGCQEGP